MNVNAIVLENSFFRPLSALTAIALRSLQTIIAAPPAIFLIALTAMLFRPPDLKSFPVDRAAFALLIGVMVVRLWVCREPIRVYAATWPMLGLTLLGLCGVLAQPYESQSWSVLAAKWIVPFAMFHLAGLVFYDDKSLRHLEIFCLTALVYLTAMSIFFLIDLKLLIFPRFIFDEAIGIHADRARGPFLQAVANGVCLNILGLIALHSFVRGRVPKKLAGILLLAVPLALLATKTRAVWLSGALSIACLAIFGLKKMRLAGFALVGIAALGFCTLLIYPLSSRALTERLEDRSPLEFRFEMYQAGWQMFTEKPLIGWGSETSVQPQIAKRISDFHPDYYLFHNTYLELVVERGALGLGLYAWLMICFFRPGKLPKNLHQSGSSFLGPQFRNLWPLLLGVYLLNASAVVMNYQFVNGLLFTLAGILSAQAPHRTRLGLLGEQHPNWIRR